VETYLCRKNDGHLIRVVGPAFDIVCRWAADGVPLKIVFQGIDRYFERYYRKGSRRRPVRLEFCEDDVLDVFDEWMRAVGIGRAERVPGSGGGPVDEPGAHTSSSLPAHLQRVVAKLTNARATGTLGAEADAILDRIGEELDRSRASPSGLRGAARQAAIDRLSVLDAELVALADSTMTADARRAIAAAADAELEPFRATMESSAYDRARQRAIESLIRDRLGLPTVAFR
jgi:hypothetical protein